MYTVPDGTWKGVVIINLELCYTEKQSVYGVIQLNYTSFRHRHGLYSRPPPPHKLIDILTADELFNKYYACPPAAVRELEFAETLLDILPNDTFTNKLYRVIRDSKLLRKRVWTDEFNVDLKMERKVVWKTVNKWQKMKVKSQTALEQQDLVPMISITNNIKHLYTMEWAYFLRIEKFGYDVAVIFEYHNSGNIVLKSICMDLEEIKYYHLSLGSMNIMKIEEMFGLKQGHYAL